MGTRCDFYAGRGLEAKYLGSIGHDAYAGAMAERFAGVTDRASFDARLAEVFAEYGEIKASKGWPWPWRDSHTTDTVVAFDDGQVWSAHYSKRWALLSDYDNPTDEPCVFPDMLAAEEATPEGRLRLRLRYTADFCVGPDDDVLRTTLYRATYLLAFAWMHYFEDDAGYWTLRYFGEQSRRAVETGMLARALQEAGGEFDEMLRSRRAKHNEEEWGLLQLLKDTGGYFGGELYQRELTPALPMYFGRPCPEAEVARTKGPLDYVLVKDPARLREGMRLLNLMLDRAPYAFALVVASQLAEMGALPVDRAEADAWMDSPQEALGGQTLEEASKTPQGREAVRTFAANLVFSA